MCVGMRVGMCKRACSEMCGRMGAGEAYSRSHAALAAVPVRASGSGSGVVALKDGL